jgi:hypothetical protein
MRKTFNWNFLKTLIVMAQHIRRCDSSENNYSTDINYQSFIVEDPSLFHSIVLARKLSGERQYSKSYRETGVSGNLARGIGLPQSRFPEPVAKP